MHRLSCLGCAQALAFRVCTGAQGGVQDTVCECYCVLLCSTTVYYRIHLWTIVYYCVLMLAVVYYCRLLCTTVCYSVLLCKVANHCVLLCTAWCHWVLLCTTLYYCALTRACYRRCHHADPQKPRPAQALRYHHADPPKRQI